MGPARLPARIWPMRSRLTFESRHLDAPHFSQMMPRTSCACTCRTGHIDTLIGPKMRSHNMNRRAPVEGREFDRFRLLISLRHRYHERMRFLGFRDRDADLIELCMAR